jgi:Malectin domain
MLHHLFSLLLLLAAGLRVGSALPHKVTLKVNLGGGPIGDFLGEDQVYDLSDEYPRQFSRVPVANTPLAEFFQTQRFAREDDLVLFLPVPDGVYSVTLLMAETYQPACRPGGRKFDIYLGTPVLGLKKVDNSFDLYSNAGCNAAFARRFDSIISREGIIIRLGRKVQHPCLAGFVVEGVPVQRFDGTTFKPIRPSAAGPQEFTTSLDKGPLSTAGHRVSESRFPPQALVQSREIFTMVPPASTAGNTFSMRSSSELAPASMEHVSRQIELSSHNSHFENFNPGRRLLSTSDFTADTRNETGSDGRVRIRHYLERRTT